MKIINTKTCALTAVALVAIAFSASNTYAESQPNVSPAPQTEGDNPVPDDKGDARSEKFERRGKEMFEKTDTDKDGFLSKEEMEASHRARMEEMFNKTDVDDDGKLSAEELQKGRESMRDRFKQKYQEGKDKPQIDKPAE